MIEKLLTNRGQSSILEGALWFHSMDSSSKWKKLLKGYFPEGPDWVPVAYDWLGSHYVVPVNGGNIGVYDLVEVEFKPLPIGFDYFLNEFPHVDADEILQLNFFGLMKKALGDLKFGQIYGCKVPLILGGEEEISNFKISDMEVAWEVSFQIWQQVKDLPEGTEIDGIDIG